MFSALKSQVGRFIPELHPVRLFWHKLQAILAATYYGFPAQNMIVVGITGTNGKTSTAYFAHHLLMSAAHKTGLFTTAEFKIGHETTVNMFKQTTVSPWVLQQWLLKMKRAGCTHVVMEVTSHAMVQSRTWGIPITVAVFTNLTRDHFEYHGGEDAYRKAKGLLFAGQPKVSIVNQDDASADYFNQFPAEQSFRYGVQKGVYQALDVKATAQGCDFTLKIPNAQAAVRIPVLGDVNALNAVAAACVALSLGVTFEQIVAALPNLPQVPGRFEPVTVGQDFQVIVDYAHSEDSLEKLCKNFKALGSGRLIVVFGGCGGGRDQAKFPSMGAIVHRYADLIVLTNDDPYEDDPLEIARMLREGIPREEGEGFWQILDRRAAIWAALRLAQTGDTVLICGKGAESFQVLGRAKVPHDDRVVAREFLSQTSKLSLS